MGVESRHLRFVKYQEAARRAEEELRVFWMGEPSQAIFPADEILQDAAVNVVFDASTIPAKQLREKHGDLARRTGDIINTITERPSEFPPTKANLSFIERHFPKILKFAITARNKRKLHPEIQRILGL